MLKKICGNIIKIFHIGILVLTILLVIMILLTFKVNLILIYFALAYCTIIIVGWVFFGNCILTPLENYLLSEDIKYNDGTSRSQMTVLIQKYFNINENFIYYLFIYMQIFFIIIYLSYILMNV